MINPWEYPDSPDPEPKTCPTCGAVVTDLELIDARTVEELHAGHAAPCKILVGFDANGDDAEPEWCGNPMPCTEHS